MANFVHGLFSADGFMPHGHCYLWEPGVLWLHILSDALIALAYLSIPCTLLYFIRKRKDLPFSWIFVCFAAFIVSCGATHLLEIYVIWHPVYWVQGVLKAVTALVSLATAVLLVRLTPRALAFASPAALRAEIVEREKMERKFKGLLESAPDAIVQVNARGEIVLVNTQTERLFDYSREQLLGQKVEMLLPERFRDKHPGHRGGYFAGPHTRPMGAGLDLSGMRRNGAEFPVEISLSPLETEEGTMAICAIRDITERKRGEAVQRESEERFRHAFEDAPIGMAQVSLEGRWMRVNRSLCAIVGYSESELLAIDFQTITHPDDLEADLSSVRRLLAGEIRDYKMEKRYFHKTGGVVHVQLSVSLVRAADGAPLYFLSQIQDITTRKQAEEELRWKTALLEAQVDSDLDGILVQDSQGRAILQNRRLNELWKSSPTIAAGEDVAPWLQFAANQTKNSGELAGKAARLHTHMDEICRDTIELLDGTFLEQYSSPVRDKGGNYFGRIWTFRDITERRKLEAQFFQAQKMDAIGQLAAGVAHDFNNILVVIQLQAGLIKEEPNAAPDQADIAGEIQKAATRASNLTRQLLMFSRQQPMQPRDLNVNDLVTDIAKMIRRVFAENVAMRFQTSPLPLWIHADAGMIDQVLLNLAVNARDAMPGGGRLVIETSPAEFDEAAAARTPQARAGSFVCLNVTDTGAGIKPEILARIFEPFFTTKEVGKGTGLGLATVLGIIQQHQGWITVESELGLGTTFRAYFPRVSGPSTDKSPAAPVKQANGGSETILLVEDDSALRAAMRGTLSKLGYRTMEAPNGFAALEVWGRCRDEIQLLITDLVMPGGMHGNDLAWRLHQDNAALKVIYVTGYNPDIVAPELHLQEGVNFLSKPFLPRNLAQIVRNCLDSV